MHPETPRMNLIGFSHITGIMALCADEKTHVGGARRLR
ncbi:MAG: hypothetical protein QOE90_358 [Thermoplasmata archaeon]|jgi:hypothetical protein|nr:hypothetical protein [Thermoplasmata archaeon]